MCSSSPPLTPSPWPPCLLPASVGWWRWPGALATVHSSQPGIPNWLGGLGQRERGGGRGSAGPRCEAHLVVRTIRTRRPSQQRRWLEGPAESARVCVSVPCPPPPSPPSLMTCALPVPPLVVPYPSRATPSIRLRPQLCLPRLHYSLRICPVFTALGTLPPPPRPYHPLF